MRIKRIVAFVLSLILAFSTSVTAFSLQTQEQTYSLHREYFGSKYLATKSSNTVFDRLEEKLLKSWDSLQEKVDISSYRLSFQTIITYLNSILDRNPEYFFVDLDSSSCSTNDWGNVEELYFGYIGNEQEVATKKAQLQMSVNKILSNVDEQYTDLDKIIYFHDYIASHNEYDPMGVISDVDEVDFHSFDAYGCLVNNLSVCQGISDAFYLLCQKSDIEVYMCNSYDMCHAWNVVELDGKYYHLDITWDDSSSNVGLNRDEKNFLDVLGVVSHDYFLKSDDEFLSLDHYNWTKDNSSVCSVYTDAFWQEINSSIYLIDGYYYFLKNSTLVKRDAVSGEETALHTLEDGSYSSDGRNYNWSATSSVLAYNYIEDYLFFTSFDGVYAYSLKSGEIQNVFTPEDGYIGGIVFYDETLYCDSVNVKNGKLTQGDTFSIAYVLKSETEDEPKEYTTVQLLNLKKYLAKNIVIEDEDYFDINLDGVLDATDALLITKKIAIF